MVNARTHDPFSAHVPAPLEDPEPLECCGDEACSDACECADHDCLELAESKVTTITGELLGTEELTVEEETEQAPEPTPIAEAARKPARSSRRSRRASAVADDPEVHLAKLDALREAQE